MRHLFKPKQCHDDPPEAWEYPLSRKLAIYLCRRRHFEHPFVPHRHRVLPEGAFAELRDCCGVRAPEDLFVVPENVRGTGDRRTVLRSPTQILGFGREAVGLWVADYEPAVPIVLPIEHIAAMVDLQQLLYGRLRIFSTAQTLTLRYNAVAHRAVRWHLLRLRRLLWRKYSEGSLAVRDGGNESLPRKWRLVVRSDAVRLSRETPAAIHTENVWRLRDSGTSKQRFKADGAPAGLAAITPEELVLATEPRDFNGRYGLRLMYVLRSYVEQIGLGERPTISARGLELPLPITSQLAARVGRTLSRSGQSDLVEP